MRPKIDIALKKNPKQQRAIATVAAIVEAGTYILGHEGAVGFTANKIAEKAGVNIASFYQYYPSKEALLFHIVRLNWETQLARLKPILLRPGPDHARKLRAFIREFFRIEEAEADLRKALRASSVELRDTSEFRDLIDQGAALTRAFLKDAIAIKKDEDLDFHVDFIVRLVTSFAERATDGRVPEADLMRQADLLSDMLISHFNMS